MIPLEQIDHIPHGLLELERCSDIQTIFAHPTLIHLTGKHKQPLFISVLLHANEDTGFLAVQKLLRHYQQHELPRSVSIFFGNVYAAKADVRRLTGQPDYNRVWPGTDHPVCDETDLMQQVVDAMRPRQPFASIDVHNNTGKNPHYGCINFLQAGFLHLAALFSRTVVFFEIPKGVQSMAMAQLCPSITIECGLPHLAHGVEHATNFLHTVLHLEDIPRFPIHHNDIDIYQTVARVTIPRHNSFSFTDSNADIRLDADLENLNFAELTEPTPFGIIQNKSNARLEAWNDEQHNVGDDYFSQQDKQLLLTQPVMPAMLTTVESVIRQDCLCYLMQRLPLPEST